MHHVSQEHVTTDNIVQYHFAGFSIRMARRGRKPVATMTVLTAVVVQALCEESDGLLSKKLVSMPANWSVVLDAVYDGHGASILVPFLR
jgi:uncharacterized membrane-anchored protein